MCACILTGEAVIKLLLNEKEYVIPGCSSVYCPLSEAKEVWEKEGARCRAWRFCCLQGVRVACGTRLVSKP